MRPIWRIFITAWNEMQHPTPPRVFCPHCQTTGAAVRVLPGSVAIELLLWLCFLLPGILYTAWRQTSDGLACGACGWTHVLRQSL